MHGFWLVCTCICIRVQVYVCACIVVWLIVAILAQLWVISARKLAKRSVKHLAQRTSLSFHASHVQEGHVWERSNLLACMDPYRTLEGEGYSCPQRPYYITSASSWQVSSRATLQAHNRRVGKRSRCPSTSIGGLKWFWWKLSNFASVAVLVQNGLGRRAESGWTRLDGHCIAAIVANSGWTTLGTYYSHIASHIPFAAPLVIFRQTSAAVHWVEAQKAAMMGDSASADENLMLTCQFDCTNYDKWGTIKQFLELFRFEAICMTNDW